MPQDHYVAQTYLRAFADPETPGRIHAYRKSDAGYFSPSSTAVCKSLNWDLNSKYLSPQDALGRWLKIFEPHWAGAVTRLLETHNLLPKDKYLITGYWAYLSTCTPTSQRVATGFQQAELDETYLDRFIAYAEAHPDEYPQAAAYLPLVKEGSLKAEIDRNYPKAVVTTQLLEHQWCLYHQEWNVVWNNTAELFLTSDNPSCFDYEYGGPMYPARYLPLAPRLALWTPIEPDNLPKIGSVALPARRSIGREATAKFVRDMNRLVLQSAENIVLSSEPRPYISACVEKYKNWRVRSSEVMRIPTAHGHYEVIQTRASPQT
jgi:Protein of unknown function (DUF4238)